MVMIIRTTLAILVLASGAQAVTLTITPDKATYSVGETITLSVFGDAEGAAEISIFGRMLFEPNFAVYIASAQETLTSFGGFVPWTPIALTGGNGFADAFGQLAGQSTLIPDGPLTASVTLNAISPGTISFSWETGGIYALDFFGLTNAPGGSVTVVPEPSTAPLIALGLLILTAAERRRQPRRSRSVS